MGYWLKHFIDGSTYRGTDADVAVRKASWRMSPCVNMMGVELEQDGCKLEIFGLGEYWQSEQLETAFPQSSSFHTKRRIERKVSPGDTHYRVVSGPGGVKVVFNGGLLENARWFPVNKDLYGKWLVVEYNMRTKTARYFFKDNKV